MEVAVLLSFVLNVAGVSVNITTLIVETFVLYLGTIGLTNILVLVF